MYDNIQLKSKLLNLLEQRHQKDPRFFVNKSTISVELGITEEEAFRYADYLVNNKWAIISEPQTPRWSIMITEDGKEELKRIRNVIVEAKKNSTNEKYDETKLLKIEEKIKEINLEKERRVGITEQKVYGAAIEMLDILRNEIKRRDENSKEIIELKSRLAKLENVFSNPHEQLMDNVYRPCYNQMINDFNTRQFIHRIPDNKWIELEAFWRLKTESEMKLLFEKYTEEREKWSKMLLEFENAIQAQRHKLGDIVTKAFDNAGLIEGVNNYIKFDEKSSMEAGNWIQAFDQVIFDSNIQSGEQLYKILLDYSVKTRNGHHKWLENWWNDNNGLFTNIIQVIPKLIKNFNCSVTKRQMDDQREILKKSIEELTLVLEERLKKS